MGLLVPFAHIQRQVFSARADAPGIIQKQGANMVLSPKGETLIKQFERLALVAYLDQNNVPTIGWGHTGADVTAADVVNKRTITATGAEALFVTDAAIAAGVVREGITAPLTQNQFDALVSLVYNIGVTRFLKSTMRVFLNAECYGKAADQFAVWRIVNGRVNVGLVKRRAIERAVFEGGKYGF